MKTHAGERINRWRLHRALTLKTLAEAAGMHLSTLHRIVHGQQSARDYEIYALASALKITAGELLDTDPPQSQQVEA